MSFFRTATLIRRLQVNEKQHVKRFQAFEPKHFQHEEVCSHHHRHVSADEIFPTRRLVSLGCWRNIMPLGMLPIVWSETLWPRLAIAPTIRSYPQLGSSRGIRTTRRSISWSTGGRPTDLRNFDTSNFLAIRFRYQANSVSGLAAAATSFSALRPNR